MAVSHLTQSMARSTGLSSLKYWDTDGHAPPITRCTGRPGMCNGALRQPDMGRGARARFPRGLRRRQPPGADSAAGAARRESIAGYADRAREALLEGVPEPRAGS